MIIRQEIKRERTENIYIERDGSHLSPIVKKPRSNELEEMKRVHLIWGEDETEDVFLNRLVGFRLFDVEIGCRNCCCRLPLLLIPSLNSIAGKCVFARKIYATSHRGRCIRLEVPERGYTIKEKEPREKEKAQIWSPEEALPVGSIPYSTGDGERMVGNICRIFKISPDGMVENSIPMRWSELFVRSIYVVDDPREEWDNLMNHANGGVALSGLALLGKVWPLIGLVDIAESEDAYVFRFSLPGVSKDEIVKFCYGQKIKVPASNVAPLYCAAHFLEINDDLHQGKLISKAEAFLNYIILSSWKDTFRILKSCESVSLWSKDLHIVKLCWEAISWKACSDTGVSSIEDNDVLVNVTADDTSKLVKLNGNWFFNDFLPSG
ncbi:Root phototropism protein 3 [Capsicum baccatum]|uniref:Root phototropism protein 3 n=1 Tax=Capsicum baccatum TaxID=33114 RepID=A0A2G2W7C7_CAPBA|nr:Root phototropism protein 3 [Capsicum baccatum]